MREHDYEENTHIDFSDRIIDTIYPSQTIEAQLLREVPDDEVRAMKFDDENSLAITYKEYATDLLDTACYPTAWRHFIANEHGETTTEDLKAMYFKESTGKVDIEAATSNGVMFPTPHLQSGGPHAGRSGNASSYRNGKIRHDVDCDDA